MFSRRDMLAATAAGGLVTVATRTTADAATPVKSDISFGNPNDPPQGAINAKNCQGCRGVSRTIQAAGMRKEKPWHGSSYSQKISAAALRWMWVL